jgi:hypothetical protein
MACGGSGHELAIWDMEDEEAIQNRFASRVSGGGTMSTAKDDEKEVDFEAMMANDAATQKALEGMSKSKKKKKGKKKAHKKT